MTLKEQRAAALKAAQDAIAAAKAEQRAMTDDERSEVEAKRAEIEELDAKIKAADESDGLMAKIANLGPAKPDNGGGDTPAKSLGEHFVKSVGADGLSRLKTMSGATVAAPEFIKAQGDAQSTPSSMGDYLTDFDRTIVQSYRRPVVIADLLGTGTIGNNSNAITYLVEGDVEGDFGTVGEGGTKPQFHVKDPTTKTDSLKKIAGLIQITDEMSEDAQFWISEINERGLYMLALAEEGQLLNGSGSGNNLDGLLNRGVQTASATDEDDNPDSLFRAMTQIQTKTGLSADGLVIHPADYQRLRLAKDANSQYYGGGFFQGPYGNGNLNEQQPVWGLRTVVSSAVDEGQALVGAFKAAATVYRKGGVRVESTNSHAETFASNINTTRIEERLALAVRVPKAVVEVTLSDGSGSTSG
jgi:HK97 family phage major capsid protein